VPDGQRVRPEPSEERLRASLAQLPSGSTPEGHRVTSLRSHPSWGYAVPLSAGWCSLRGLRPAVGLARRNARLSWWGLACQAKSRGETMNRVLGPTLQSKLRAEGDFLALLSPRPARVRV